MSTPYTPANTWHATITVHEDGDEVDAEGANTPIKQVADRTAALNNVPAVSGQHLSIAGGGLDDAIGQLAANDNTLALKLLRGMWNMQAPRPRELDLASGESARAIVGNPVLADADYGTKFAVYSLFTGGAILGSYDGIDFGSVITTGITTDWTGAIYAHGRTIAYGVGGVIHTFDPTVSSTSAKKTGGPDIVSMCNAITNDFVYALDQGGQVWKGTHSNSYSPWVNLGVKFLNPNQGSIVAGLTTADAPCLVVTWLDPAHPTEVRRSVDDGATWTSHVVAVGVTVLRVIYTDIPGKRWIAVCTDGSSNTRLYSSTDAITWTLAHNFNRLINMLGHAVAVPKGLLVLGDQRCAYYDGTSVVTMAPARGLPALLDPAAYVSIDALNVNYVYWAASTAPCSVVWPL